MSREKLIISKKNLKSLISFSEKTWPLEACALLEGERLENKDLLTVKVTKLHFAKNVAHFPEKEFEVDPKKLLFLHRELRGESTCLIGVWHSHPNGSTSLSEADLFRMNDPMLVWLLTPVVDSKALKTLAFIIQGDVGDYFFKAIDIESI